MLWFTTNLRIDPLKAYSKKGSAPPGVTEVAFFTAETKTGGTRPPVCRIILRPAPI